MEVFIAFLPLLIVLAAKGEAAAVHKQPKQDWLKIAREELRRAKEVRPIVGEAKNTILFLGDGMGITSNTASRIYYSQTEGVSFNEARFSFERFPYVGLAMTYSVDAMVTDSAAAATSYLNGEKAAINTLGLNQNGVWTDCSTEANNEIYSSIYHCSQAGKATGIVTTTRVTHASPAGVYAHSAHRAWETDSQMPKEVRDKGTCKDIAQQLIEQGDFLDVIMGGGRIKFLPNTTFDPEYPDKKGARVDGKNLIEIWKNKQPAGKKYMYVDNLENFKKIDPKKVDKVMGLFEPSHMHYEADRETSKNNWAEPSLTEMTEMAINILKKNDKGFCLFVESGRIDHAHHYNNAYKAITDTIEFSKAVAKGVEMTDIQDTLTITTADHGLPMTTNGYTGINTNILGAATEIINGTHEAVQLAYDGLPYSVLSYTNGPPNGYNYHNTNGSIEFRNERRKNLTEDFESGDAYKKDYIQYSPVPLVDASHSGEEVGIYAQGPMAHLFHTVHENTFVAHLMMYATCVGPYKDDCVKHDIDDAVKSWPVDPEMVKKASSNSAAISLMHPSFIVVALFSLLAIVKR